MFGGKIHHPGTYKPRSKPFMKDIDMPGPDQRYGHLGRDPNTNYHTRLLHHTQRETELFYRRDERAEREKLIEKWRESFIAHSDKRRFQGEIKRRVEERLRQREEEIEEKREKLSKLLAEEEHLYIRETVDQAQRGGEKRKEEMKMRSQQLKARNEAKRLALVKEKKLQQYLERSIEIRPVLEEKNALESKKVQLQQMRENESRRESERELDKFWHDVMMKEVQAKTEREEQEAIDRHRRNEHSYDIIAKQIEGQKMLQLEEAKIAEEDRLEMMKVQEEMRKEREELKKNNVLQKQKVAEDLKKQMEISRQILAQRKKEEEALEKAFNHLSMLEVEREKAKISDSTNSLRKEMTQYRNHLRQLEKDRKVEEGKLGELLEEYRKSVEAKQDEAKCKAEVAKQELHKTVLQERAKQLEDKRVDAERQLKIAQDENAILNYAIETNQKLDEEARRQEQEARDQYRQDLLKQIEYSRELARREREELQRQLELGKKEEEYYQKLIKEICNHDQQVGSTHPFRKLIETYDCHCKTNIKPKY